MKKICMYLLICLVSIATAHGQTRLFPTAKDGGVFDAAALNHIYSTIQNSVLGFQESDELLGTWECTNISIGCAEFAVDSDSLVDYGMYQLRTQNLTFFIDASSDEYLFTSDETDIFGCREDVGTNIPTLKYIIKNNILIYQQILLNGVENTESVQKFTLTKYSDNNFNINGAVQTISCQKQNVPPDLPTGLEAVVERSDIVLTWYNVENETGFRVLRRVLENISDDISEIPYAEIATTDADVVNYTDTSCIGICYYKIVAVNAIGESTASNVVREAISR